MNTIGIRVKQSCIYYCIVLDKDYFVDKLIVPKALNKPQQLTFIRTNFYSIFREYNIKLAAIRLLEPYAFDKTNNKEALMFRMNIEGILLELFENSMILNYFLGVKASMANHLNREAKELKNVFEGDDNVLDLDDWGTFIKEEREAVAIAFIQKKRGVNFNDD